MALATRGGKGLMQSDYDAGHGLPSDFPSDPMYGGIYIAGGLCTLLLLAMVAAAVIFFLRGLREKRRTAYDDWPLTLASFVRSHARRAIHPRAERRDDEPQPLFGRGKKAEAKDPVRSVSGAPDMAEASRLPYYVTGLLGGCIALGEAMNKQVKGLNDALDGFKEIKDAVPVSPALAGNGTVINIAVNQTGPNTTVTDPVQTLGGPYGGTAIAGGAPGYPATEPLAISRDANIWMACNKFYEDWNPADVMAAAVRSAQDQLYTRPPEPPRPQA